MNNEKWKDIDDVNDDYRQKNSDNTFKNEL